MNACENALKLHRDLLRDFADLDMIIREHPIEVKGTFIQTPVGGFDVVFKTPELTKKRLQAEKYFSEKTKAVFEKLGKMEKEILMCRQRQSVGKI